MEWVVGETVGESGLDGKVMPAMANMPASREGLTMAIAQLKKSKPGARLATVADVKADGPKGW